MHYRRFKEYFWLLTQYVNLGSAQRIHLLTSTYTGICGRMRIISTLSDWFMGPFSPIYMDLSYDMQYQLSRSTLGDSHNESADLIQYMYLLEACVRGANTHVDLTNLEFRDRDRRRTKRRYIDEKEDEEQQEEAKELSPNIFCVCPPEELVTLSKMDIQFWFNSEMLQSMIKQGYNPGAMCMMLKYWSWDNRENSIYYIDTTIGSMFHANSDCYSAVFVVILSLLTIRDSLHAWRVQIMLKYPCHSARYTIFDVLMQLSRRNGDGVQACSQQLANLFKINNRKRIQESKK